MKQRNIGSNCVISFPNEGGISITFMPDRI